ncbi:hypothetical protein MRX96_003249 [Rhipicephalus microplus]
MFPVGLSVESSKKNKPGFRGINVRSRPLYLTSANLEEREMQSSVSVVSAGDSRLSETGIPLASTKVYELSLGPGTGSPAKALRHQCRFCPYATQHRGSLVLHERVHMGEHPFGVTSAAAGSRTARTWGAKVIQLGPRCSTPCFSGIHNPAPPNTHRSRRTPQKTEHWAKVSPVGLLFPETRSNDVIPQAVQPQQSPPWQGNIRPPYLTQLMGALPIGLDLARMIADMVQHYMRQQHPQWHALRAEQDMSRRAFAVGSVGDTVVPRTFGHVDQSAIGAGRSGNASDWVFLTYTVPTGNKSGESCIMP